MAGEMALSHVRSGDPLFMDPTNAHVEPDVSGPRRRVLVIPSPLQQLAIPAGVAGRERSAGLIVRPAQRIPRSRHQNIRHSPDPKTSAHWRRDPAGSISQGFEEVLVEPVEGGGGFGLHPNVVGDEQFG